MFPQAKVKGACYPLHKYNFLNPPQMALKLLQKVLTNNAHS